MQYRHKILPIATLLYFLIGIPFLIHAQNVGIGTATPHASAKLDVQSTTSGLLIPRMTSAQRTAIANPATGLLVYQLNGTTGFYYYNGTSWVQLGGGDGDWTISGSNMYSGVSGNVGIGITNPLAKLDVNSSMTGMYGTRFVYTASNQPFYGLYNEVSSTATTGSVISGLFKVLNSSGVNTTEAIGITNSASGTNNYGIFGNVTGSGTNNYGINMIVSGGYTSRGLSVDVTGTPGNTYGVYSYAHGTGSINYGIKASASGASSQNWAGWFGGTVAGDGQVYIKNGLGIGTTHP